MFFSHFLFALGFNSCYSNATILCKRSFLSPSSHTSSFVSSPMNFLFAICAYMCQEKQYCHSPFFLSHFVFIILCNINYSDPLVLILALIPVNVKALLKHNSITRHVFNFWRSLQPSVYIPYMK